MPNLTYNLLPNLPPEKACRHCFIRAGCQARGLCRRCHDDPVIRSRHRPIVDTRPELRPEADGWLPTPEEITAAKMEIRNPRSDLR